jgi:hypothetical protein
VPLTRADAAREVHREAWEEGRWETVGETEAEAEAEAEAEGVRVELGGSRQSMSGSQPGLNRGVAVGSN